MKLSSILSTLLLLCALSVTGQESERRFVVFNASDGLADNSAQSIVCTKTGRMVVTSIGHINFYDGMDFSHVDAADETKYMLPNYLGHYHPYFDKYHHLWLKDKRIVTCVNLTTERFVVNIDSLFSSMGMQERVSDLFVDDDGGLWLVSGNMIYSTELKMAFPLIKGLNLQDLATYGGKELLLFYENGEVVGFDLKNKNRKLLYRVAAYDSEEAKRYYRTSLVKRYNDTFLQIRDGEKESVFMQFDVKKRQWTVLMRVPYKMNNLRVFRDVAYIASEYGYWTYNLRDKTTNHIEQLTMTDGKKLLTDINTIEFDRQGGMWVGTERRGLLYAKPFSSPFKVYGWDEPEALHYYQLLEQVQPEPVEYHGESVNCVFTDSRGWSWVGTRSGLMLYYKQNATPETFGRKDGMFNDVVHSIVETHDHNIWVSTSYGISCFLIRDSVLTAINSYNLHDNVPNEMFINGRARVLDDGTVIMQALDHVLTFQPASFHYTAFRDLKFYPKLIGMTVNGTQVEAGTTLDGKLIMDRAITRSFEMNVDYNHNSLTFLFSGLNFFRPMQTFYRYRVPELDPEWQIVSFFSDERVSERGLFTLALPGLAPGDYHIEMQVSMYADVWIQEPIVWLVHVNQPWWRTTGVYLTLGLILLILLLLNLNQFLLNVRLKMKRNAGESEMLRQLRTLIRRCDGLEGETFSRQDEAQYMHSSSIGLQSEEFMSVMLKVIPFMKKTPDSRLTVSRLCDVGGVNEVQFLELMVKNIGKKPHILARRLRLQEAARLLRSTEMSIEDVAEKCGFASPNYFAACFFRFYHQTPVEYRLLEN